MPCTIDIEIPDARFDQIPPIAPPTGCAIGDERARLIGAMLAGVAQDLAGVLASAGGLPILTMAVLASGRCIAIPSGASPESKDAVTDAIAGLCRKVPVVCVITICEAWVVSVSEHSPQAAEEEHAAVAEVMRSTGSLGDHPRRREMFLAMATCVRSGVVWTTEYTAEIIKNDGAPIRLGPGLVRRRSGASDGRIEEMTRGLTDIAGGGR